MSLSSSQLEKLKETNRKLVLGAEKAEEKRMKKYGRNEKSEFKPDVSTDLKPYASVKSVDSMANLPDNYNQGWSYRSRATVSDERLGVVGVEHTPPKRSKSPTKSSSPKKKAAANGGGGGAADDSNDTTDAAPAAEKSPSKKDPAAEFPVWIANNHSRVLDILTVYDTGVSGKLTSAQIVKGLEWLKCPNMGAHVTDALSESAQDGKIIYAEFLNSQKRAGKLAATQRAGGGGSVGSDTLGPQISAKLPPKCDMDNLKQVREQVAVAKKQAHVNKQQAQYKKDTAAFDQLQLDGMKRQTSRDAFKEAYVTYSRSPKVSAKAIEARAKDSKVWSGGGATKKATKESSNGAAKAEESNDGGAAASDEAAAE